MKIEESNTELFTALQVVYECLERFFAFALVGIREVDQIATVRYDITVFFNVRQSMSLLFDVLLLLDAQSGGHEAVLHNVLLELFGRCVADRIRCPLHLGSDKAGKSVAADPKRIERCILYTAC